MRTECRCCILDKSAHVDLTVACFNLVCTVMKCKENPEFEQAHHHYTHSKSSGVGGLAISFEIPAELVSREEEKGSSSSA